MKCCLCVCFLFLGILWNMSQFNCVITDIFLRRPGRHRHLLRMAPVTEPAGDTHFWGAGIPRATPGTTGHYGQGTQAVLISTRKGTREALSLGLGFCLIFPEPGSSSPWVSRANWISLQTPRVSWPNLQGLQKEFTCPRHKQTLLIPFPRTCSLLIWPLIVYFEIIESLRLEKTSKIMKSKLWPPCRLNCTVKCHIYSVFELFQEWWVHHFTRQPVQFNS